MQNFSNLQPSSTRIGSCYIIIGILLVLPQRSICVWFQGFLNRWPSGLEWSPCSCSSHSRRYPIQISTQNSFFQLTYAISLQLFYRCVNYFCLMYISFKLDYLIHTESDELFKIIVNIHLFYLFIRCMVPRVDL